MDSIIHVLSGGFRHQLMNAESVLTFEDVCYQRKRIFMKHENIKKRSSYCILTDNNICSNSGHPLLNICSLDFHFLCTVGTNAACKFVSHFESVHQVFIPFGWTQHCDIYMKFAQHFYIRTALVIEYQTF